jgi:plasmid stability protein
MNPTPHAHQHGAFFIHLDQKKSHTLQGSHISVIKPNLMHCHPKSIIDSNASTAYILTMSATITIRNLSPSVKQLLRIQAASHGRSMEAEAREILTRSVNGEKIQAPRTTEEMRERLLAVTGIWKDRTEGKSTNEIMKELRCDD